MSGYTPLHEKDIIDIFHDPKALVQLCNRQRESLNSFPAQSHFRVYAFLIVKCDNYDGYKVVEGANMEQGYIGGAICAERAALSRLRMLSNPVIVKIVVTTDSVDPISPGMLCREYLMSSAAIETDVIIGNGPSTVVTVVPLGSLLPFPYLYRFYNRKGVTRYAESLSRSINTEGWTARQKQLYTHARVAIVGDDKEALHPVRLAAAVLLENGEIERTWMLKGLEYGCTMCPVTLLLREMEKRRLPQLCKPCNITDLEIDNGIMQQSNDTATQSSPENEIINAADIAAEVVGPRPECIVMLDQWGVAHAPFASARAILTEWGYGHVQILVHDEHGKACVSTAEALCPPPKDGRFLSHDSFKAE